MTLTLDHALLNGRVRTLNPEQPFASAVGIAHGRIAVVGDDVTVRRAAGAGAELVDLRGAVVLPGIVDSHLHPFQGALLTRGADLTRARTLEQVRELVAAERARCGPDQWVVGFGLDYNVFDGHGIHGELVAEAAGGGPALLTFEDIHTELATPRALELAGVDGSRSFGEHAEIVVDADGAPTGELREMGAIMLVRRAMPRIADAERYWLCAEQLKRLAAAGITGAHGMDGSLETLDVLRELEANGDLVTRLVMPYWAKPETPREVWHAYAEHRDAHGARWRAGVAKLFSDGVIDSGTSWLLDPDSEGDGVSPLWGDIEEFHVAVMFFAGRGFQVAVHATGDRAVRETLDAYRAAGAAPGIRHRIEHIETLHPDDLPRFAAEGVVASMQPQHMMDLDPHRSDDWSRRLGPARCDRAFPIRALHESGALLALGSDWPVASYDWREGMAVARLRRPPGRLDRSPYDDQRIDAITALRGYTANAARAVGDGDRLGMIAPGYLADLTVAADDPVEVAADDLVDVPILLTMVDGDVVFRHDDLSD